MTITEPGLTISEVAELSGLSAHTLRYYERAGLMLGPVDRATSTHRRYTPADVTWIGFLTKLRATSMPIAQVREYAELARQGDATEDARLRLLREHRLRVIRDLDDITNSLAAIDTKIAVYEERITRS